MTQAHSVWRASRYCRFIPDTSDGGGFLHNSFMGALMVVPSDIGRSLAPWLERLRAKNRDIQPVLTARDAFAQEMHRQGFVVDESLQEETRAEDLLSRERDYGTHLIILPHEDCNFRCTYCYESFERGKMSPEIVAGLKSYIAREMPNIRLLNVGWFGGEPCLARDVIYDLSAEFQSLCENAGIKYRAAITTNGYFLDEVTVGRLLDAGIQHFQITIDGSEEAHDTVRRLRGGQPTYRRIFQNLVRMTEQERDFSVAVRVNFNPLTIRTIDDFLKEAAPHLADDPRFFLDFHAVGRWGGPNDQVMAVVEEQSAAEARLGLIDQATCHGFPATSALDALKPHGAACYAGKASSMVVGSDGTIYKCTVAFEDDRNKVGQLYPDGTLEIDRDKWRAWTEPHSPSGKCGTCSFSAACQSRACPLAAMDQGEPPCPFTPADYERMVTVAAHQLQEARQPSPA
ncbi:Anaerobic sulfatase-maturating enzyme [Roseivivax sp. THAF40]|uniref:radical SAM/SPASM domain-containing protein n=1 Tax=unclassified Roseivivax TaxID=2639302 RepID=UPI0012689D02|nr:MULTISPECIES: radical SAM protein [unclassified Roseivivax]QFS83455.1 Anaerobic sulfatase-maturating enzyme [Roseivivax sp. THAF197b]QFT47200.1 Anaerobic sulfatase-maturating enzyme [Roseivivax sp. THAF40]